MLWQGGKSKWTTWGKILHRRQLLHPWRKNYDHSAAGLNGGWVKPILDIGYTGRYIGARTYHRSNNHDLYVFMVIESEEGEMIFQV